MSCSSLYECSSYQFLLRPKTVLFFNLIFLTSIHFVQRFANRGQSCSYNYLYSNYSKIRTATLSLSLFLLITEKADINEGGKINYETIICVSKKYRNPSSRFPTQKK